MVPKSKVKDVAQIMADFDDQIFLLKREYRKKVQLILAKAEKNKLEKVRKSLRSS